MNTNEELLLIESRALTELINKICDAVQGDNDLTDRERIYWLTQANIYKEVLEVD